MNIVSCYSSDIGYTKEAEGLKESLHRFEISDKHVESFKSLGSWEKNCQYKAVFLKNKLKEIGEPVVWLDADARLLKYPELFKHIDTDVAWHYLRGSKGFSLLSGTLYLTPNERVYSLMDDWIVLNNENDEWDQRNLSTVVEFSEVNITRLPREYCQIFDNKGGANKDTVILHRQASRKLKRYI